MLLIILIGAIFVLVYLKYVKINQYWAEKGVPHIKAWPVLGNMAPNFFQRRPFVHMLEDLYYYFPNKRYVGIYQFQRPTLLLRDLELIKMVMVKEMDVFPDHKLLGPESADSLVDNNLLNLTVARGWHDMRATLSPAFTSNKLKIMFKLMEDCAEQMIHHLEKQGGTITVELKDTFSRFTNDVIGTTAFGVTYNSFKDSNNKFYTMGKDLVSFGRIRFIKSLVFTFAPALMKLLNIGMFSKDATKFFESIIKETLRVREEKKIVRPDMIHLLMEARKNRLGDERESNDAFEFAAFDESPDVILRTKPKAELTDDDITAQAIIFFFAGFDSSSTVLCHLANELALHPDVQQRLREEIDLALPNHNVDVTYEKLQSMKYLDCVVSETLRLWPPFAITDRVSVQPFTINPVHPGEKPLHLPVGSELWIPINTIQRDPNHYPNPEKFDPERFNEENKRNIKPFSYLPFGSGPRFCIGSRFVLLEIKLIVVQLLRKFEIVPVKETKIPLVLSNSDFSPMPDEGIWVGFKPRNIGVASG